MPNYLCMFRYLTVKDLPYILITFIIPLILFILTSSDALMFDDAAEFATVIRLGSIAHPPGTPAYIFCGMLWTGLTSLTGMSTIQSLNLFSSLCISLSGVMLYIIFVSLSARMKAANSYRVVCCSVALAFSTAATTWAWANTVEVYSFQVLAMCLTLLGLVSYQLDRSRISLITGAAGVAAGLANHHLTMIAFLPFIPIFFIPGTLIPAEVATDKKKKKIQQPGFISQYSGVFRQREFWIFTAVVSLLTIIFYGWMVYRAQDEYPFMFGQPSTLSALLYHISGGSYSKNLTSASTDIISSRLPYFLKLTAMQLFLLLPFYFLGLAVLVTKKLTRLVWLSIIYYLILFVYQLNNNQWSSTDAYMLLPFTVLFVVAFYGIIFHINKFRLAYVLPVCVASQIAFNYGDHDRRSYPVSSSLMGLLDKSAPKNSILIIADWSTVIQYYYYRIVENFRPDLVVLNYDIKFTHYRILPVLYPEFYKKIKPEYDHFIAELGKVNPHQPTNTGCDLSTVPLMNSFKAVVTKIESVARSEGRFLLTDPHAHYFYGQQNIYDPKRYVSGAFSSSMPGDSIANNYFTDLKLPFLDSPLLLEDPAALDKLVDFQAMLDRHIEFYQANNDSYHLEKAQLAHERILKLQRQMRKSMPFAYKVR